MSPVGLRIPLGAWITRSENTAFSDEIGETLAGPLAVPLSLISPPLTTLPLDLRFDFVQ